MVRMRHTVLQLFARVLAWFALCVTASGSLDAHQSHRAVEEARGVAIPNLTHGQLHVLARYRSEILDLASRQASPSPEARTLENFVNLQFAYCMWGMMPGSLTDEANPFNECSHAYVAGSKALLDRLRQNPQTQSKASALAERINLAMMQDATALDICVHSFEPFDTAQIIMPAWKEVSFNPLAVLLGIFLFCAASAGLTMGRGKRLPQKRRLAT
jgi:hypothetical protein